MNPDVAAQVLTNGDLRNSTIRRSLPSRKGKPANAPSGPVPATPEPVGLQTAVHKPRTDYKSELLQQLALLKITPPEAEYRFCERKWRFDWAYPDKMLAIEYQGGAYYKGMGHQTTKGFTKDCLKFSTAASLGWRIILVTAGMVRDGSAAQLIERALLCR